MASVRSTEKTDEQSPCLWTGLSDARKVRAYEYESAIRFN